MKTITTIKAWILICSIIVISSAATEHPSSHHDGPHHGDSMPQKKHQNTIVPFGIQIPGHVLSAQDVACISADPNIFEIMNKAQESCNGTDMRCTFYHFVNHGYQNIGTLDINKGLFDDLLMKFDNWLLTAEKIEKDDVPLDGKTKEDSSLNTTSINVNGSYSSEGQIENSTNVSKTERLHTNQGVHIDKVDHNTNDSDDDKIVNTHHIKHFDETNHRNHHHKWKNGNHIKLVPEYDNDHRYFEVFLPKDEETGKPRTIYVEIDRDKNEFVLLDEEIDKKLNGIEPIKIELDELSEIADTAFNVAKSSNKKHHINSDLNDDEPTSEVHTLNTNSAVCDDIPNFDIDVGESTQNILNPSICNIHANQQLIPDNMTGNVKKILNISKNLAVPNKYINQAQFYVESQIDNLTDELSNDHLELLENTNETDTHQTGLHETTPLDTIEFNENNTSIDLDLDNIECPLENVDVPCKNANDNSTENYEPSTEDENETFDDDSFIELGENNDTSIDIDFDDTHDFSKLHLNEPILQDENPVQENKLKATPYIYTEPKLTSSLTAGVSDYTGSQLDAIPSENRQGPTFLQNHSSSPGIPSSPYTTVPLFGKDLAKVLETDSHLQSSFPAYATLDTPASASQNTPLNSNFDHPSMTSYNSPLDSDFGHQPTRPKMSDIFPSPPVECVVKLNKDSKYSPPNFGFSWLPSYKRIEELRLPCRTNPLPRESIMSLPDIKNTLITDSICHEPTSSDHTAIPGEEPILFQTVPSLNVDIQEPSSTTQPYLETDALMPPKPVLPSKLYLPKSNSDLDRISTNYQLNEIMPDSFKDAENSPCPMQQIPIYLQPTKPNQALEYIKNSPFDNNSKETMIPCSPCKNSSPYTSIPYFANPYLKTPHFIPQYLEPLLPVTTLQPASKISTLDSLPISLDQSYPYLNGDYSRETKPISLLPNTAFSPVNPLLLGPGFVPNTLPCQNLWNNIPYLPYSILSDQNLRNYPQFVNNYLTPSAVLQPNQILKPLSKTVSSSVPDQPCSIKNILEITPQSYAPFSPVYTPVIQMNLNSASPLERDLQSLSLKYGIPLSKMLNFLETEISDADSKTNSQTLEAPYLNLVHDSSLISKPILSKTNTDLDDENRGGYEESPLDSSLIGPHLTPESSLMLESNDSQSYSVLSETEVLPSSHSKVENETKVLKDSSLIGPHLSTIPTSNFVLSDENRNENEVLLSESDINNLSLPLDSSLLGPHLEIGSPPIVQDSINSHNEVPITISSQNKPKVNIQNQPSHILLDSSLIGSHLPTLSAVKPLLGDKIQIINSIIPLETDLTDLTLLDSPLIHAQEDIVHQLDQSKILQHEKTPVTLSTAVPSIKLHKTSEYLPSNITEEELILESDSSTLSPLDSSLVGSGLKLENSPIIVNAAEDKSVPAISLDSLQNTENKVKELESIILPSSLLPTLLNNPVKADSNLNNLNTQETNLNEELKESSLDTNVELPLTDISLIPFKETDFKIVEVISGLPSHIDDSNIPLLTKDSTTLKHKLKSSELTHVVDSKTLLDNSLIGPSILHILDNPEISKSLASSNYLDSSLIVPTLLQEIDSREISPILNTVDQLQTSLAATTINQNKKPSEIWSAVDSSIQVESSLIGPTLHHEINSKETSTAFDSFDKSLVPSLHETKESSATTSVLNSSQLDSSLMGPSLHQETLEVSRAFDSKDLLDSSLVGPHLSTVPFSNDEIQMINEELQPKSGLANFIPLDSSLVGPHLNFESELKQSEISRFQNPESSSIPVINPDVCETTVLPCDVIEEVSPLEPITLPSICTSDLQELLSKFTNAITKSQLSPSELKPCDKLLSSIAKISLYNKNISPSCTELQKLSEYSPITIPTPTHEFPPVEPFVKLPTCFNSNYFPTPKTLPESLLYAQGVPQIPISPYSPFIQMKPLIEHNWLPQPLNFQNIPQSSPSFRPVVGNAPAPFVSNALIPLTPEDSQLLLDLASHSNLYPQLFIPNMNTPGDAIAPSSEWATPSYILPLDKYSPLHPKKNSQESTISNSEHNPILVDDIMSLLDENSYQLLKDMSVLPLSQSSLPPTIPVFEKGDIVSPSLLDTVPELNSDYIKTRPSVPISITNPLVQSSIYNPQIHLYNPQNIPYMIQTPNISPCNLQPYSNIPLHSQFSEIIGPKLTESTESPKAFLEQLLPKPCIELPIILPSSSLGTMLQLSTALNELNSVPCELPPEYFTPISPICTTPLSNVIKNPILPIYGSPLSVSYAKPISTPSPSLSLNAPYKDCPLYPLPVPFDPATPLTPKYSSPVMPLKITPISDYPYSPTVAHNKPISSKIPYKSSQTYSSPYLPIYASPISIDTSPGSPNIMSRLPPAMTTPISPVFYEPLSTPYLSPLPKSLTNLGLPVYSSPLAPIISLSALGPTPTGLLSPSYLSPDVTTYSYSPLLTPINTLKRPSNVLSATFMTPVNSNIPSYSTPLSLNPMFNLNPPITAQELQSLRQINSLPISNAVNPFLNTNQRIPLYPNKLLIQNYSTHVPKSSPFSSSQIKKNIPCENALESNFLTSPLTEEIPCYDVIEESNCNSNDKDAKFYEQPKLKYPLQSLSYTLAPAVLTEALSNEDLIKLEDTLSAPVNNFEPSLQTKLCQHHRLTPYTLLHGKPLLKPRPPPELLLPPSLIETIPQNIFDNTPLVPSLRPLKYPVPLPTSIISSALLKPLIPLTSAPNFPISSPLLPRPSIDTSLRPYKILPMDKNPLIYCPYYSTKSQDISSLNEPRELRNIVTPQVTPVFSQVLTNAPFMPISSPKSQPLTSPSILDNYIQLPYYEPKSKPFTFQGSIVKPSSIPHYNQYVPIISHIPPLEMPITPQYITPLTPPQNLKKTEPVFSPQYCRTSSVSPDQISLQDSLLLNEAPIHYQPYIPQPVALTSSINNMLKSPPVALPYTVLPSVNMVEPESINLNRPQSLPFTPQYSLPSSFSPVPLSRSPIVSHSNAPYSMVSPHIPKQALTNHIIPSSLFMSCDTDFQPRTNKLSPPSNISRKKYPSPSLIEPLAVPFYTPSRPLDMTANPENILKPKSPLSSVQYAVPLSSSPYYTVPLRPTDSYQTQPLPNVQYTTKPHPKSLPIPVQYASPSLSPMYTSLPLETVPKQLINDPSAPEYSLPYVPVYDTPIHSSPSGRNPFINPDFKPITQVPSYTVPKKFISSPILAPFTSIQISNLRPQDISQELQNLFSSPITSSAPLHSSSLLKPLVKTLPQKSREYYPHKIPSNSQYVSELPIESVPQLLPSTNQLLKSPLLKPLFTTSQNNVPLLPMHFSNTNTAFPDVFPMEVVPSVNSPDIALSNYLPSDSIYPKYSGPYDSLVSEMPKKLSSTSPNIFLKSPFNKHFKSPASAPTNMPLYTNYDILEPLPKLPVRVNIINTAKPIEISAISASESSPLTLDSLDAEMIEKAEPYELIPDLKYRFAPLPLGYKQHRPFHPAFTSKYLASLQPSKSWPSSPYTTSRPKPLSSVPSSTEAELIDTTDFIPLSQIKFDPLITDYSPTDRKAEKPNMPSNIPKSDILQLSPYNTLLDTEFPPSTFKQLPPLLQISRYSNQIPLSSPIYLSAQEYKDLTQGLSPTQALSSPLPVLSSTNTGPELVTSPLTGRPSPQIPIFTSPMSITSDNWLQSPTFSKSLPFYQKPLAEKENIQTFLNKFRPANKITSLVNNYPYEAEYSRISEEPSELDSVRPVTPLIKSKQHYTEYIEYLESNEENDYESESDNVSIDENQPSSFETKSTESLPEIIKALSVPNYNKIAQIPQRLSQLDHLYANNHIGKSPQVFTVPTYNSIPLSDPKNVKRPSTTTSQEILKDFNNIPNTHFEFVPELDNYSLTPNEYYPEIADSPENVPITISNPQNYLNTGLKYSSLMQSPLNTIELAEDSEMTPTSYSPYNNIDDIKYSGYKTYQIPSFKSPETPHNLGIPTQRYSPSIISYSSPNPSKVHQNPSTSYFYKPTKVHEPQYQTPITMTTPLQTKLDLDNLQESPEFDENDLTEVIPISADSINDDNELKTSLINYINKREDVKNNLFSNNADLTIPIGNIAITRKEPYNANTIETNNPSIGLKVWKSNVKIAEAELKLKFKDLSVNNFMPIVNNLDKYDMEEIRKIVKNYIDEKYGKHIEINEPYTIDNKYTVLKDFDSKSVDNKYNLLWPTNYV